MVKMKMLGGGCKNEILLGCKKISEIADGMKSGKYLGPLCGY